MLSFSPFSRKVKDTGHATGVGNSPLQDHQQSTRKSPRSLKRWLSMRKISQEYNNPRKQRYSNQGILQYKDKSASSVYDKSKSVCSRSDSNTSAYDQTTTPAVNPFPSYLPLMPTGCGDTNWLNNDETLLSLLQHGFDMPASSPTPVPAPPPSAEDNDTFRRSKVASISDKTRSIRKDNFDNGTKSDGPIAKRSSKPKSQPPRRKRSLIYAMYCTAQADGTAVPVSTRHQPRKPETPMCDQSVAEVPVPVADEFLHGVPLHNSVPSLATTENLSVTFFSCQSISSPVHKIDTDAVKRTENALGIEINDARSYSPVHIDKDALDLGDFGALDDEDAFVGSTRFKESRMASVAEAGSAVPSMSSSCSSLAEDIPIVQSPAYRCNSRYAPRLSTIERAHDGRVCIRPSSIYMQRDDAEKISLISDPTAEASTTLDETSGSSGSTTENSLCQSGNDMKAEPALLPPQDVSLPLEKSTRLAESSPVYAVSQEAPMSNSRERGAKEHYCSPLLQQASLRPMSAIVTPPESPDKASTATVNASFGSSVVGSSLHTESASKPELLSKHSARKKHYSCDDCDFSQPRARSFSYTPQQTATHFAATRRSYSYDGRSVPAKSTHTRIASPLSVAFHTAASSVASKCQHPSMRSQAPADPQPEQRSLLFDGSQCFGELADSVSESMASAVSTAHCAPGCMNVTGSGNLRGVDYSEVDDIDGDVPLADILEFSQATIVSPLVLVEVDKASTKKAGAQVNKENKHAQSLEVSDKTRWYSSALAKAAQLDGFRHLNFRIKVSANQKPRLKGNSAVNKGDARLERIRRRGNSNSNSINDNDSLVTASPAVAPIDAQEKVFRQQRKKTFRFNEAVAVYETWDRDAYDRKGMPLSRLDAEQLEVIKEELNAFKMNEMYVHEDSRANTHIIC